MEVEKNQTTVGEYVYDGDGNRVKSVVNGVTTYYIGSYYEWRVEASGSTGVKYYYAGSQRVAMRVGTTLSYLFGDHLGSTSITTDASGSLSGELRYLPFGETRYESGQREEAEIGLYFYGARWYDSSLARFIQADTIIPEPGSPMAWDRYAYTLNNPVKYTDPSGHFVISATAALCIAMGAGAFAGYAVQVGANLENGMDWGTALTTDISGEKILAGAVIAGGVMVGAAAVSAGLALVGITAGAGGNNGIGEIRVEEANNLAQSLDLDQDGTPLNEVETSINAGQRTINFLSEQLRKVDHIMQPKHA